MTATCMELIPDGPRSSNGFGSFYWCDLPSDPRSADATPRCTEHLTPDTTRPDAAEVLR